jgi:hypothetical protein
MSPWAWATPWPWRWRRRVGRDVALDYTLGYRECRRENGLEIANVGCGVSCPYIRRGAVRRLFVVGMRRWWVGVRTGGSRVHHWRRRSALPGATGKQWASTTFIFTRRKTSRNRHSAGWYSQDPDTELLNRVQPCLLGTLCATHVILRTTCAKGRNYSGEEV